MEYERIDLISLFDLEFHNDRVSRADLSDSEPILDAPMVVTCYSLNRLSRQPILN